jgi:hypothetical protein
VSLRARIKDANVLTSLAPEELAPQLLSAVAERTQQGGIFNRDQISRFAADYPPEHQYAVELAVTEAWRWLEIHMFILPAPGANGQRGYFVLGRRGKTALQQPKQFTAYTKTAAFPRELLHPIIAERVWAALVSRRLCGRGVSRLSRC